MHIFQVLALNRILLGISLTSLFTLIHKNQLQTIPTKDKQSPNFSLKLGSTH